MSYYQASNHHQNFDDDDPPDPNGISYTNSSFNINQNPYPSQHQKFWIQFHDQDHLTPQNDIGDPPPENSFEVQFDLAKGKPVCDYPLVNSQADQWQRSQKDAFRETAKSNQQSCQIGKKVRKRIAKFKLKNETKQNIKGKPGRKPKTPDQKTTDRAGSQNYVRQIRKVIKQILKRNSSHYLKEYQRRGVDANKGMFLLNFGMFRKINQKNKDLINKVSKQIINNLNQMIQNMTDNDDKRSKKLTIQMNIAKKSILCLHEDPEKNARKSFKIFYQQQDKSQDECSQPMKNGLANYEKELQRVKDKMLLMGFLD